MEYMEQLHKDIMTSIRKLEEHSVQANAIFINKRLIFSKIKEQDLLFNGNKAHDVEAYCKAIFVAKGIVKADDIPVICGLKAFYDPGIPDDVEFMVFHSDNLPLTKDEKIESLEKENQELKEKLHNISEIIERMD